MDFIKFYRVNTLKVILLNFKTMLTSKMKTLNDQLLRNSFKKLILRILNIKLSIFLLIYILQSLKIHIQHSF